MPASYPTSSKSFTTKNTGDTIQPAHVNDAQDEITAIETNLLAAFPGGSGAISGQLKFPATQNPSADPTTLDDYEEGSWTPVIGGIGGTSGQVYSGQTGGYIKIGRVVIATFDIQLTTLGTVTGAAEIQGFPFAVSHAQIAAIGAGNTTTPFVFMGGWLGSLSSTGAALVMLTAAATAYTTILQADLSNTTRMTGSFTYITSA